MSNDQKAATSLAEALQIDLEQAAGFLDKVASDAFVDELGKLGFPVETKEQFEKLVKIAASINSQPSPTQVKSANLINRVHAKLFEKESSGSANVDQELRAMESAELQKAANLATDPAVAAHILALLDSRTGQ